jgi:predicted exporter
LRPETFFASKLSLPYRTLWLGALPAGCASAVSLFDLRDPAALSAAVAGLPGVRVVDEVAGISETLHRYRRIALMLAAAVYALIGLLLAARYGLAGSMATLLPALGGGLLALAALGWCGAPVNLFHVLALLLVLGMGSDYTIFLRESRGAETRALLAVLLAAATAVLSFGLLAFSSVPFIRAIGAVQAPGICFSVLLALALRPRPLQEAR